jgi:pimeloyl-ACP methyl ester carboxylesterase
MRILPITVALSLLLPVPAARPARPVHHPERPHSLPAFAAAYRQSAVRMLAAGCPYASWAAQGRRFLLFDPAGDGRAAEVFGDLGTATRIAVLVPGVQSTLADFDRGLGGVARRAPGVQGRTLHRHLSKRATGVAVISWLGYDPPEGLGPAAATEGRARAGAAELAAFVREVLRQRPGAAVTLIGHSYGAVVVGLAAQRLPRLAALVALGAPGMGADRAADLGGAPVFSALAPHDWIRRVPQVRLLGLGLGRRPSHAAFGATALPTGGVAGHDYYLVAGSATLRAVTDVVLSGGPDHERPGRVS